jgi:hypothetical protein
MTLFRVVRLELFFFVFGCVEGCLVINVQDVGIVNGASSKLRVATWMNSRDDDRV